LKHAACSRSPHRGPTLIEIQRWEDDGGAVLPDATPRRDKAGQHRHYHEVGELAAAD
jgi:hypothetical protein